MHHILQKRKDFNLIFNFFFKIPKFAIESKKTFFFLRKSDLYLMKIQISFMC